MNENELQTLLDKQAITEVIHRYCRGLDRMDRDMTLSCWHPGGTDDHAPLYTGSAEGFVDWLWPVHAAMQVTRHVVTNILIEVTDDTAASETYYTVYLRIPRGDDVYDLVGGGRYLDQFEKIDGVWAIRHRTSINDMSQAHKVDADRGEFDPPLIAPNNPEAAPQTGARDKTDTSYNLLKTVY